MTKKVILSANGLCHSFRTGLKSRKVIALKGVDMEITPGEVVALLGPNGSGKTTLLNCLLGVIKPDSGLIRLFGLPPGNPKALDRLGYVPENDPPWGRLSGLEVAHFAAKLHGLSKETARDRTQSLLSQLGLAQAGHRKVKGYSKGMTRRLALVVALLHEPDLLVLDEPTAGLDPLGSGLALETLKNLKDQGTTILLSSHYFHEIEALCDRVIVLHEGEIAAAGPTHQVLADPGTWEIALRDMDESGRARMETLATQVGQVIRQGPCLRGLDQVLREAKKKADPSRKEPS